MSLLSDLLKTRRPKAVELMDYDIDFIVYCISNVERDRNLLPNTYRAMMHIRNTITDVKINDHGSFYFLFTPSEIRILNYLIRRAVEANQPLMWYTITKLLIEINK